MISRIDEQLQASQDQLDKLNVRAAADQAAYRERVANPPTALKIKLDNEINRGMVAYVKPDEVAPNRLTNVIDVSQILAPYQLPMPGVVGARRISQDGDSLRADWYQHLKGRVVTAANDPSGLLVVLVDQLNKAVGMKFDDAGFPVS